MDRLVEMCQQIGLSGKEALDFIKQQQEIQQREREFQLQQTAKQEELKKRELEVQQQALQHEAAENEKRRQHELELKKLEMEKQSPAGQAPAASPSGAKLPDLPPFLDHKDDLDNYLDRFERFAKANGWAKDYWAVCLSNLLTGQALETYSRLSKEASTDYDAVKLALIKRYGLTEEGYLAKFRAATFDSGESAEQFVVRLRAYLDRWIKLSEIEESYEGLQDLVIKEQFFKSCSKELEVFLREKEATTLTDIIKYAEQYCSAREAVNVHTRSGQRRPGQVRRCFICQSTGHMKWNCPEKDD